MSKGEGGHKSKPDGTTEFNKQAPETANPLIVVCNFKGYELEGEMYEATSLEEVIYVQEENLIVDSNGLAPVTFQRMMKEFADKHNQEILSDEGSIFIMRGDEELLGKLQKKYPGMFNSFPTHNGEIRKTLEEKGCPIVATPESEAKGELQPSKDAQVIPIEAAYGIGT